MLGYILKIFDFISEERQQLKIKEFRKIKQSFNGWKILPFFFSFSVINYSACDHRSAQSFAACSWSTNPTVTTMFHYAHARLFHCAIGICYRYKLTPKTTTMPHLIPTPKHRDAINAETHHCGRGGHRLLQQPRQQPTVVEYHHGNPSCSAF